MKLGEKINNRWPLRDITEWAGQRVFGAGLHSSMRCSCWIGLRSRRPSHRPDVLSAVGRFICRLWRHREWGATNRVADEGQEPDVAVERDTFRLLNSRFRWIRPPYPGGSW